MKQGINRYNACMLLAIVCEPCNLVQLVVGATCCRKWGEPLHICKIPRWDNIGSEDLLDYFVGYLKDHSHLYYMVTLVRIRLE